jgi:hypothetical protein
MWERSEITPTHTVGVWSVRRKERPLRALLAVDGGHK